MKKSSGRWRACLELLRLSNAPTCITNVLVGCALAAHQAARTIEVVQIVMLSVSVLLLYAGGMALNDVVDVELDRRERPSRPVPSGRISFASALAIALIALVGGCLLLLSSGIRALLAGAVLVLCIVAYNLLHNRSAASVVLMGACRGLVYLVSFVAVAHGMPSTAAYLFSGALAAYIVLLSVAARAEATGDAHISGIGLVLLVVVAICPGIMIHSGPIWLIGVTSGAAIAWIVRSGLYMRGDRPRIAKAVMGWLAGICLIDACYLALLDQVMLVPVAIACFLVTAIGHRYIAGS